MFFFFFKQKTAYELRISDWSSDVCSSDLGCQQRSVLHPGIRFFPDEGVVVDHLANPNLEDPMSNEPSITALISALEEQRYQAKIGRASCRERVCQYV